MFGKNKKAKIQLRTRTAVIPTKGSLKAAGYDLYADEDAICPAQKCVKISTGVSITPPRGYYIAGFARSGLATKQGLRPANCTMIVDEDYTGEIIVPIYNDSEEERKIKRGDRIAQIIFLPYLNVNFEVVEQLKKTKRGEGGFGHSGK